MSEVISRMIENYEHGRLSRRALIQGLATIAAPYPALASGSTFRGVGLNHIAIRESSGQRSRDFYQKLLGLPVIRDSESNCFLGLGKNFLTLFQNPHPGLDHYCIAIEGFKADSVMEELRHQGLPPTRPSGSDRLHFSDPDSLTVQLSSVDQNA
jgi:catechol 2,3-dioxygenase-like lactoylglutathione lyase family enzyme